MLTLLSYLPKNLISFVFGKLSAIERPVWLVRWIILRYCRFYPVRFDEMEHPLAAYASLGKFFVRNLRAGCRPVGKGIVAPADGLLSNFDRIAAEQAVQAKGIRYSISALLGSNEWGSMFAGGYSFTFYLAPHDYHHVHSPTDCVVEEVRHIPGTLWPVNEKSASRIGGLFTLNERIVVILRQNGVPCALIMVGATNVGSMTLSFDEMRTNSRPFSQLIAVPKMTTRNYPQAPRLERGARLGTFHLGSTVVLLFPRETIVPNPYLQVGKIRYGENIAEFVGH